MPRTLAPCATPGCPDPAIYRGRCDHCASRQARHRARANQPYQTANWLAARVVKLHQHPWCADHLAVGQHVKATDADHHPTPRRVLIAQGVTDPDAPHRLVSRCHPCHSRRTGRSMTLH